MTMKLRSFCWLAAGEIGPVVADVLRLQLLLGARIREVTGLHASELKLEGADPIWCLPRLRSKSNREIIRPLPPLALAIIGARMGDNPLLFQSPANPGRP